MDYGIKIGDQVKPHDNFNFDMFVGPSDAESVGVVVDIRPPGSDSAYEAEDHGIVWVLWEDCETPTDHTFKGLTGFVQFWEDLERVTLRKTNFGVVLVEEDHNEVPEAA